MSLQCYRGRPTRMVHARALLRCRNTTSAPPPPPSRHWHRHRHRHRPERVREAIAVQPALTFLCARRGNEFGVIVDRQPWWVRCSLFARGVVVVVAQFFFFFTLPPHRTRLHRRRACRKYYTKIIIYYYTLYYNILCTHIARYRFPVMIIYYYNNNCNVHTVVMCLHYTVMSVCERISYDNWQRLYEVMPV